VSRTARGESLIRIETCSYEGMIVRAQVLMERRASSPGRTGETPVAPRSYQGMFVSGHAFRHAVCLLYECAFRRWIWALEFHHRLPTSSSSGMHVEYRAT